MPIRLVLADAHPLILDGLENLFRQEGDFQVVARCQDSEEALRAVREHRPDILVIDLRMPGKGGLAILREIRRGKLPTRVVLLTAALDEDEAIEALTLGVSGVVLKEMAPNLLLQCLRKVHAGGQWVEKQSFSRALDKMLRREAVAQELARVLTPREIEIVRIAAMGLGNKDIADRLCISEGTVKVHLHTIYEKLDIDGRVKLSLYARDKGLL